MRVYGVCVHMSHLQQPGWTLRTLLLSEISQTEKDIYCVNSLIYGIFKSQAQINRIEWWLPGWWGEWGDNEQ